MALSLSFRRRTNANVTVYNKYKDAALHTEKYQRAQLQGVYWEDRQKIRQTKGGMIDANTATIIIPFVAAGTAYLAPVTWQALVTKTGKMTLQEGDIIVRGLVTDEIGSSFTPSALKAKYDEVLTITSVEKFDTGAARLYYWAIGAN
jgi:hypothetical protein